MKITMATEAVRMSERLRTDKRTAEFSFRMPEYTKQNVDKLSKSWKTVLIERLLVTTARVLHEARFDPRRELVEDYDIESD